VTDQHALEERVARLLARYGLPCWWNSMYPAVNSAWRWSSYTTSWPCRVGNPVRGKDTSYWPIVTYDAKWRPGSREYRRRRLFIRRRSCQNWRSIEGSACRAFRLVGCRDYARSISAWTGICRTCWRSTKPVLQPWRGAGRTRSTRRHGPRRVHRGPGPQGDGDGRAQADTRFGLVAAKG